MTTQDNQWELTTRVSLVLHKDYLNFFQFLKDNPTKLEKNGEFYRLTYYLPYGTILTPFQLSNLWLSVGTVSTEGWEIIRDLDITFMGDQLFNGLAELEKDHLIKYRQGTGMLLIDWIFDLICYGIYDKETTAMLVRAMFVNGYDYQQTVSLFSAIVKRTELASYFLQEINRLYKGVEI